MSFISEEDSLFCPRHCFLYFFHKKVKNSTCSFKCFFFPFFLYTWLSFDFSILYSSSFISSRGECPVSRGKMIKSVLDCDLFHCLVFQQTFFVFIFFYIAVFALVQTAMKVDWFFFTCLFGSCAQWKHFPFCDVHITAVFLSSVVFWFSFHLQLLHAVLLKAMQQWLLPVLLPKTESAIKIRWLRRYLRTEVTKAAKTK